MSVRAMVRTLALAASSSSASGFITPYLKLNQLWQLRNMIDADPVDPATDNIPMNHSPQRDNAVHLPPVTLPHIEQPS
jgi:hypothetical protein